MPPIEKNIESTIKQKSSHQYAFLFVLVFLLVLSGIFGVWYFSHPLPDEKLGSTPSRNQLVGWQTYTNSQYGFEVKYPENWFVLRTTSTLTLWEISFGNNKNLGEISDDALKNNAIFGISIDTDRNPKNLSLDDWFAENLKNFSSDILNKSNVIVGGQPAIRIEIAEIGERYHYYLKKNNSIIEITYPTNLQPQFQGIYNKILSTFKLISTSTLVINMNSWHTYINTKYNYQFEYPDNVGILDEESSKYSGPPTNPQEDMLLITDKEGTFHFQINKGFLYVIKQSPLGEAVLSTLKYTK